MWEVVYDIKDDNIRSWLIDTYGFEPKENGTKISVKMSNKWDSDLLKVLLDYKLDERDSIYESWFYEVPDEPKEEFGNPWRENGLKDSDFI